MTTGGCGSCMENYVGVVWRIVYVNVLVEGMTVKGGSIVVRYEEDETVI